MAVLPAARAQEQAADAPEISRNLLYHPARRIEVAARAIVFRAAQFTYRFDPAASQWEVQREKNFNPAEASNAIKAYRDTRPDSVGEYRFAGVATEDEGILEVRRGQDAEPVARPRLWNRQQLANAWLPLFQEDSPTLTREQLARDTQPDEPEVSDVVDDGTYLWLAIRHFAAEGYLGLGTVLRFDPKTNQTQVYQPRELATSSVTHIATAAGRLWLGTQRVGEASLEATAGLVRFDPATGELRSYLPSSSPLVGRIVTALQAEGNVLWVGTDAGICRAGEPAVEWTCWRIVPTVRVSAPVPLSNRPGGQPRGRLAAGSYEVRWANAAFFEVATPDGVEGWIATDDLEEYARREFNAEAYELANTYGGGAGVMRLLENPASDPLAAAQVYRAPLERLGAPTAEGWQRVRARVGWISRRNLDAAPVLQPVSP